MSTNIFKQFFDIRQGERAKAILMSLYFFLHISIFWILKPLKRGMVVSYYGGGNEFDISGWLLSGAEVEQLAKILNMIIAYLIVIIFTLLVRYFSRQNLVLIFCGTFALCFLFYAELVRNLNDGVVWSFYVFGDMYNTAMLALFWAFMNDIVVPNEAKRIYGIVGLGGVVGGFIGSTVVRNSVQEVGRSSLLLGCLLPIAIIAIIGVAVNKIAEKKEAPDSVIPPKTKKKGNAAFEGAKLVFSSKYLLAIAGIIGLYEIISNIIDFQLSVMVGQYVIGDTAKDAYFALVGQVIGIVSIIVQLFFTSFIMKRFGVGIALLLLPISIFLGSIGFLVLPVLIFATIMSASDNSLNYSINQSAKEALYVPTTRDEKYKAKAFIDMFVQRFAKVVAVVLNLGVAAYYSIENVRWLSIVSILILVIWIGIVKFAGRKFDELSVSQSA